MQRRRAILKVLGRAVFRTDAHPLRGGREALRACLEIDGQTYIFRCCTASVPVTGDGCKNILVFRCFQGVSPVTGTLAIAGVLH